MEFPPTLELDKKTLELYEGLHIEYPENPVAVRQLILMHHRIWNSCVALKGKYVAFEGIDGSGKTSQKNLAVEYLRERDADVYSSDEPKIGDEAVSGRYTYSGFARAILDGQIEAPEEKNGMRGLFAVTRAQQHFWDLLVLRLATGQHALYSRSIFSNFAYQGYTKELIKREATMAWTYKTKIFPDITVFVDVEPGIAMERIGSRGSKKTLYENLEKLARTRDRFHELAAMNWKEQVPPDLVHDRNSEIRWIVVDGNDSVENIHEKIKSQVLKGML